MKSLLKLLSLGLIVLSGCTESAESRNSEASDLPSLPEDKVQTLSLGSLTDRLLGLPDQKMVPQIGEKWVIQAYTDYLEVYNKETQEQAVALDDLDAQVAPVFLNADELLIVTTDQKIWRVGIATGERTLVAELSAPLICSPLVIDGEAVFLQYLNDVVELIGFDGQSQWKTAVMATTSYYRQTNYAPCVSGSQIFFAYPGSSVLAISRDTGQVEWVSGPIAQSPTSTTAFQVPQVQSPIKVVGGLVVFTTLDQHLYCLDRDSGMVVKHWELWQRSPTLTNNDCLYFVNDMGALVAYDAADHKVIWQQENFSGLGIESLVAFSPEKIVAQMSHQQLYLIDGETGETLLAYQHAYPSLQLISSDENERLYGLDQRKNLIDIPGSLLS